jgi:hypothetical protein
VDGTLFGNALPGSCNEANINDALTTGGFGVSGVDTYFYVTGDKDSAICAPGTATSGVVAYASACDFDFDYNRPIQGGINICYHRYVCTLGSGREGGGGATAGSAGCGCSWCPELAPMLQACCCLAGCTRTWL